MAHPLRLYLSCSVDVESKVSAGVTRPSWPALCNCALQREVPAILVPPPFVLCVVCFLRVLFVFRVLFCALFVFYVRCLCFVRSSMLACEVSATLAVCAERARSRESLAEHCRSSTLRNLEFDETVSWPFVFRASTSKSRPAIGFFEPVHLEASKPYSANLASRADEHPAESWGPRSDSGCLLDGLHYINITQITYLDT